jgi:hypothetical protein
MMDKSQKLSNPECYTPPPEPFRMVLFGLERINYNQQARLISTGTVTGY